MSNQKKYLVESKSPCDAYLAVHSDLQTPDGFEVINTLVEPNRLTFLQWLFGKQPTWTVTVSYKKVGLDKPVVKRIVG